MAVRTAESNWRLHRENERRAAEETARVAADHLSARAGRHPAARRVRFVVPRDGTGRGTPVARGSVREVRQREAGGEPRRPDRVGMRPQRPVCVHHRHRTAGDIPRRALTYTFVPGRITPSFGTTMMPSRM